MASAQAMAIFNDIYFSDRRYELDFLADYPDSMYLPDAMTFAHEMVHVWQWRERQTTGYHPLRGAFEHVGSRDPYLFDPDTTTEFSDYGYEQQGAIVQDFVCYALFASRDPKLDELAAILRPVLPVDDFLAQFKR